MIRIRRPPRPPAVLATRGAAERDKLCTAYDADPAAHRSGKKQLAIDSSVYGHTEVKTALRNAQFDKCCFCEARFAHVSFGDVEHYRPKVGYRQTTHGPLRKPGYYWLAYEWSNLLVSCEVCNRRHKRNVFPLRPGSKRARCHHDEIAKEMPTLIDPTSEDPTTMIAFNDHVPVAVDSNARGERTIRRLGLRRVELNRHRERFLETIRTVATIAAANLGLEESAPAIEFLQKAIAPSAEYASMVRSFLRAHGFTMSADFAVLSPPRAAKRT